MVVAAVSGKGTGLYAMIRDVMRCASSRGIRYNTRRKSEREEKTESNKRDRFGKEKKGKRKEKKRVVIYQK